ncbi:MAG: ATP-binding protein [Agriterribacter sp.]
MTIAYRYTLTFLMLLYAVAGNAQTKLTDSLKQHIYHAESEEKKLEAILALCNEYKSLNRDTLDYYTFLSRDLAAKTNNRRLKQLAELAVAYDYARWGWADSVVFTVDPLIKENKVTDVANRDIYFKASRIKAMSYASHSRFQEGLTILYQIVSEAEAYKDSLTLGENINSIGSIALARSQPREALRWLSRALVFSGNNEKFKANKAAVYVNMADAYNQLGQPDSANFYIGKGITLLKETENLSNLAIALQRQYNIFIAADKLDLAEAALKEMQQTRKQAGDSTMYQDDNLALIDFYIQTRQTQKAIEFCKALLVSGDLHTENKKTGSAIYTNSINLQLEYYKQLARCYKITGDTKLYQQTLENIIAAKDSFYQYNSAQAIAELETKYEVQKKENTIIQQKLDITKKNNRFYTLLGIGFFLAVIVWLMFTGYRKREKLRLNVMLEKEKSVTIQSVAKAEENERKRIAADLHDNLGAYAASIVSNLDIIEPASDNALKSMAVQELRNNSQAIVSQLNDTIWALKKDALSLTSISDRIKIFIQRIQNSYPSISINVTEKIENDTMLSPSHAFHLFRIVQEAVNNALRHSKAKDIIVTIESNTNTWSISITDNGIGILPEAVKGNGLLNMKERAKEAGCTIMWVPDVNRGTRVEILPTTN